MSLRNTAETYGSLSKFFHWSIGLLIIGLLALGLYMEDLPKDFPGKYDLYDLHKAFGMIVLTLATLRVLWRATNLNPGLDAGTPTWQVWAADIAHALLYAAMILLPLSGWFMSSAGGHPITVFGLFTVPPIVAPNKEAAHFYGEAHETIAWLLIWLIGVHVLAALQHHFIKKDGILRRMLPCGNCKK